MVLSYLACLKGAALAPPPSNTFLQTKERKRNVYTIISQIDDMLEKDKTREVVVVRSQEDEEEHKRGGAEGFQGSESCT